MSNFLNAEINLLILYYLGMSTDLGHELKSIPTIKVAGHHLFNVISQKSTLLSGSQHVIETKSRSTHRQL